MAIEEHNVQTKDIVNIIDGDGDVDGGLCMASDTSTFRLEWKSFYQSRFNRLQNMNLFMRIQRKNCRICIIVHANKINSHPCVCGARAVCAHSNTFWHNKFVSKCSLCD